MNDDWVTMHIDLPKQLEEFVADLVAKNVYASPSDFVRRLIERERDQRSEFERELLEILDRGQFQEVTPKFWDDLLGRVRARWGTGG